VNIYCSGPLQDPVTIETSPFITYPASITIGGDGLGVISYYDATNADLKVAHCGDSQCDVQLGTVFVNPTPTPTPLVTVPNGRAR
jgi:hypothetical protein